MADILLAGANRAQNANLFDALQHADVRNHANHNAGNNQRNGHERNQHHGNHINNVRDAGHEQANQVGVCDNFVLVHSLHLGIVLVKNANDLLFALKTNGVNAYFVRFVQVGVSEILQVVFVRALFGGAHGHHDVGQVVRAHVHLECVGKGAGVNGEGAGHIRRELSHRRAHSCADLLLHGRAQLGGHGGHGLLQVSTHGGLHAVAHRLHD